MISEVKAKLGAKLMGRQTSKYARSQFGRSGRRKNTEVEDSVEAAARVSKGFHGRGSEYVEDVIEIERYRTNLAHLGDLVELEILARSGRSVIPIAFEEHDTEGHVSVGGTPDRQQIVFAGGDQSVDLSSFDEIPMGEKKKDFVMVGPVYSISYFADKHHLTGPKQQKDGMEYIHTFGEEEGGERPVLVYNRLSCLMYLVGGSYEIRDEGIYN